MNKIIKELKKITDEVYDDFGDEPMEKTVATMLIFFMTLMGLLATFIVLTLLWVVPFFLIPIGIFVGSYSYFKWEAIKDEV